MSLTAETPTRFPDNFCGDNAKLIASIRALLELDAKNALRPNGIGALASGLLSAAMNRLATPAVPVESLGRDAEPDEVTEYVEDYEYRGETEEGHDTCYTPNERERLLIEDAIRGWEDRATGTAPPPASVPDEYPLSASEAAILIERHEMWILEAESIGADYSGNERKLELLHAIATNQEGAAP